MTQKRDLKIGIINIIATTEEDVKISGMGNLARRLRAGKSQIRKALDELIEEGKIRENIGKRGEKGWEVLEADITKPKEIIGLFAQSLVNSNFKIDKILKKMGKKSIYKKVKTQTKYIPTLTINRKTGKETQIKQEIKQIEIETNSEQYELLKEFTKHINQIIDNTTSILYVQVLSDYKKFTNEIESMIQESLTSSRNSVRAHITILLEKQNTNSKKEVERFLAWNVKGYNNMMKIQKMFSKKDFTHDYGWNDLRRVKDREVSRISKIE